jgi:glycosyltransferase involved in cell wall biosynthesis
MKILYVASDQRVPGATGGSVHVLEVARGLAARGHEVHAAVAEGSAAVDDVAGPVRWHPVQWWPRSRYFRFRARGRIEALARETGAEAVMERYYNFGGEGVNAAHALGLPALLEVNSPLVDHPGSLKALLDAALLVRPMRRYRERLAGRAAALVAPLLEIVPAPVRHHTRLVTWGADVEAFRPERRSEEVRRSLGIPENAVAVLFSGSFRPWHGVEVFEAAARRLADREDLYFVLAGGDRRGEGQGYRGRRLGSVPYAEMPDVVAACDVGVAPYDTAKLASLRLGFYWSPLKIFEYMAAGLPTVTIRVAPLTTLVREEREGVFFAEGDAASLADAVASLAGNAETRRRLGRSARERVVARYSWAVHCEQLEGVLREIAA